MKRIITAFNIGEAGGTYSAAAALTAVTLYPLLSPPLVEMQQKTLQYYNRGKFSFYIDWRSRHDS